MGLVLLYVTLALNFNTTFLCPPTLPNPFVDTIPKPHLTYIKQNATFESKMCENFYFGTPIVWVSLTRAVGGVLKKLGCHGNLWDLDRA